MTCKIFITLKFFAKQESHFVTYLQSKIEVRLRGYGNDF